MVYCAKCGEENQDTMDYCRSCGESLGYTGKNHNEPVRRMNRYTMSPSLVFGIMIIIFGLLFSFSAILGQTMSSWGENFGEYMGTWGQNFGESMGEFGRSIGLFFAERGTNYGVNLGAIVLIVVGLIIVYTRSNRF